MRKIIIILIAVALTVIAGLIAYNQLNKEGGKTNTMSDNLKLTSTAFDNMRPLPATYTCEGVNVNPPLTISGVPMGSQSLALIMHDPDAPGGDFLHWMVWNMPADTSLISEESLPTDAVQGKNDFGDIGYGGPCPPSGVHHYEFDLYALDVGLNLDPGVSRADLEQSMNGHTLGKTTLTGTFKIQQQ